MKEYESILKAINALLNTNKGYICNTPNNIVIIPISPNKIDDDMVIPYNDDIVIMLTKSLPIDAVCAEYNAPLSHVLRELDT